MDNVQLIQTGYKYFSEGNLDGVLELFQPDIVWDECEGFPFVEDKGLYHGREAVVANVFSRLPEYYEDFKIEIDSLIGSGDKVVMTGHYTGTWKPTGKKFRANAVHVWTIKDGKAVHYFQAVDTAHIMNV